MAHHGHARGRAVDRRRTGVQGDRLRQGRRQPDPGHAAGQGAVFCARSHHSDGRSLVYALSENGWRLHGRILEISLERERRLLADLSAAEREALIGLLNRLHRRLPDMNAPIDIPPER